MHRQRDFVGYGANPPHPNWPNNARIALNICINYEEGSEPSVPDGFDHSEGGLTEARSGEFEGRDLGAESMFEYGSRIGIWRLLRILQQRELPATILASALALERNEDVCSAIRYAGYDICAHGWRWEHHINLKEAEERERISKAVKSIKQTIGESPLGWYCRYAPSLNTRRLLIEHGGFLYDSDAYNDELPYWVVEAGKPHLVVPYGLVCNDAGFMRGGMSKGDDFFAFLRDTFDVLYTEGEHAPKMMSVGLHLRITGHPGRAIGLQRFLDHVSKYPDVWICGRADIARHWHKTHPFQSQVKNQELNS